MAGRSGAVARVQLWLRTIRRRQGRTELPVIDGIFSEALARELREFQQENGLEPTGSVNLATWNALREQYITAAALEGLPVPLSVLPPGGTTFVPGQAGGAVFILQAALNTLVPHYANVLPVPYTGEFDDATQAAVRILQQTAGLPVTGQVDRLTWNMIAGLYNAHRRRTPVHWSLAEA